MRSETVTGRSFSDSYTNGLPAFLATMIDVPSMRSYYRKTVLQSMGIYEGMQEGLFHTRQPERVSGHVGRVFVDTSSVVHLTGVFRDKRRGILSLARNSGV